jgi:RES domain-containing protein
MFLEMGHGFAHRFDPLTVCSYDADVEDIVDLRTEVDRMAAGVYFGDLSCAWAFDVSNAKEPASWGVAKRLTTSTSA